MDFCGIWKKNEPFKFSFFAFGIFASSLFPQLSHAQVCDPKNLESKNDLNHFGCQLETMNSDCQDWFQQNPDTIEFAKDCHASWSVIEEQTSLPKVCAQALGQAWIDIWESLLTSVQKNSELVENCEKDPNLVCKKRLARESNYRYQSDDELRDTYTMDLVRKRASVQEMALKDNSFRLQMITSGVPLPALDQGPPIDALLAIAEQKLKDMGVKYQCYSPVGRLRMLCYAVGSVADPTLLVGGAGIGLRALRGAKWAEAVLAPAEAMATKLGRSASQKISALGRGTQEIKSTRSYDSFADHLEDLRAQGKDGKSPSRRKLANLKTQTSKALIDETLSRSAKDLNEAIFVRPVNEASFSYVTRNSVFKPKEVKIHTARSGLAAGLLIRDGSTEIEDLISQGKIKTQILESSKGFAVRKNGREFWTPILERDQVPIEILLDEKGRKIIADVDVLLFARTGETQAAMEHPELGHATETDLKSIAKVNQKFRQLDRQTIDRDFLQHGPENQRPGSNHVDYPITTYLPDGRILKIEAGPTSDPNKNLRSVLVELQKSGFHATLPPGWDMAPKLVKTGTRSRRK